ncbi:MAG: hypothetical protein M1150_04575 [Patescibacteria group bacterium]|nr:hypothetical protein [Patescibacteria group bacterium]
MFKRKSARIPEYSYRAASSYKNEEALVYRRIAIIAFLTAIVLIVVSLWGISFIYGLGSFWESFHGKKADVATTTNIYRSINPKLDDLLSATNKDRIDVNGSVADGVTVELYLNNNLYGKVVGKDSRFKFADVKLKVGENNLKVVSKDDTTTSDPAFATVTLDKTAPKLEVGSISNDIIYLDKQKEIQISGKTDPEATVTINGFQAIVAPEGSFSYSLPLSQGQNSIKVVASDKAGNQATVEKSLFVQASASPATSSATATDSAATTSAN